MVNIGYAVWQIREDICVHWKSERRVLISFLDSTNLHTRKRFGNMKQHHLHEFEIFGKGDHPHSDVSLFIQLKTYHDSSRNEIFLAVTQRISVTHYLFQNHDYTLPH